MVWCRTGLALLRNLAVLRLNGNRLGGEDAGFSASRMLERNPELARALAGRAAAAAGGALPSPPPALPLEPLANLQVILRRKPRRVSLPGLCPRGCQDAHEAARC